MALFTCVTGCRMALLECSVIVQIKTASADTNRLFVQAGNRAALPGNTCYTVVTAMSIRLAQRALVLMHSPPHHYIALQRTRRPLNPQRSTRPGRFQLWSPWPLSCPVAWTPALWLILPESTLLAAGAMWLVDGQSRGFSGFLRCQHQRRMPRKSCPSTLLSH